MAKATKEDLLAQLAALEAAEAEAGITPDTALLDDLADHRVHPAQLGACLARLVAAADLLGVDLYAQGGPELRERAAAPSAPAKPAVTEGVDE